MLAGYHEPCVHRLFRVARAHRLLTSEQLQSSYVSLRLARLLIGLFLIAHWVGSIFWGISTLQDVSGAC